MANPQSLDKLPANVEMVKVIVDTTPPRMEFREAPSRGDQIGVSWAVQDENLDLNSLRLDVLNANGQWTPVSIQQRTRGEAYFTPNVRGRIELRLSVQDLARNQEVKPLNITVGGGAPARNATTSTAITATTPRGTIAPATTAGVATTRSAAAAAPRPMVPAPPASRATPIRNPSASTSISKKSAPPAPSLLRSVFSTKSGRRAVNKP